MRPVRTLIHSTLAASLLISLFAIPSPAEACRQHDAGLPKSASTEGALADFLVATVGMTRKQRWDYQRNLPAVVRQEIQQEVQALPVDERKALMKAIRDSRVDKASKNRNRKLDHAKPETGGAP